MQVRTILINCFCQLVIFLYLLDSDTSLVVLASAGIGTAIEFWKVGGRTNERDAFCLKLSKGESLDWQ